MRTSLCLLLLTIGALPLAAQPDRRGFPTRNFPPDIISTDELLATSSVSAPPVFAWTSKTIACESCASL